MTENGWLGTVGIVRPTQRTAGFEDLKRMLPAAARLVPLCLDVRRGALDEFQSAIPACEAKVAELAQMGVDVINPSGAPPFMVYGYTNEQALIRRWEKEYKTRIFTSGASNIDAMRALGVRRFLGATYFGGDINRIYVKYFADAGFECLAMAGMDIEFAKVPELPSTVRDPELIAEAGRQMLDVDSSKRKRDRRTRAPHLRHAGERDRGRAQDQRGTINKCAINLRNKSA